MTPRARVPEPGPVGGTVRSVRTLAVRLELEEDFLERCLACGAIGPEDLAEGPSQPPPGRRERLRRLHRLVRSLDIDVFPASIIVDLLERLDELQGRLDDLRG